MPKLYHNGEPEGWQIPGKQDRKADRIDIPSAPAELAAWLNARDVSPLEGAPIADAGSFELEADDVQLISQPVEMIPGHCPKCGRSEAGALKLQLGNDLGEFSDWLESRDLGDLWAIQRAGELLRDRVRALRGEEEGGMVQ